MDQSIFLIYKYWTQICFTQSYSSINTTDPHMAIMKIIIIIYETQHGEQLAKLDTGKSHRTPTTYQAVWTFFFPSHFIVTYLTSKSLLLFLMQMQKQKQKQKAVLFSLNHLLSNYLGVTWPLIDMDLSPTLVNHGPHCGPHQFGESQLGSWATRFPTRPTIN